MRTKLITFSAFILVASLLGFTPSALAAPSAGSNPKIETETGEIDPLGCKVLKSRDGRKRGFIYKEAGHFPGKAAVVTLKALRGKILQKSMYAYQYVRNADKSLTYSGPIESLYQKFDGTWSPNGENILLRPTYQQKTGTMRGWKTRYGKIALVVKRSANPNVCYTWLIPDPTGRWD